MTIIDGTMLLKYHYLVPCAKILHLIENNAVNREKLLLVNMKDDK